MALLIPVGGTLASEVNDSDVAAALNTPSQVKKSDNIITVNQIQYYLDSLQWAAMGKYDLAFQSAELDGTEGNGEAGSPIILGYVPENWFGFGKSVIAGNGLTSDTNEASLIIGIAEDDTNALLTDTDIDDINAIDGMGAVTPTKATATRAIIATPAGENITSGSFRFWCPGFIAA
jgi:hypothetical protein